MFCALLVQKLFRDIRTDSNASAGRVSLAAPHGIDQSVDPPHLLNMGTLESPVKPRVDCERYKQSRTAGSAPQHWNRFFYIWGALPAVDG